MSVASVVRKSYANENCREIATIVSARAELSPPMLSLQVLCTKPAMVLVAA